MLKAFLFATIAFLFIALIPTPQADAAASIGRIVHTYGPAWIQRGTTRERAEKGQVVLRNDSIVTGSRGRVKIVMGDGSKVYIGAKSRVSLRKYSLRGTKLLNASINMLWGKARFFVNKLTTRDSSFRVRTPTAVLGVRGTEFIVLVPPTPEVLTLAFDDITMEDMPPLPTSTVLTEGAVDVIVGDAAPEQLTPGNTVHIDAEGKTSFQETKKDDAVMKDIVVKEPDTDTEKSGKGDKKESPSSVHEEFKDKSKPEKFRDLPEKPESKDFEDVDRPKLDEAPDAAVNAIQSLEDSTEIIIKPSFVAPDTSPLDNAAPLSGV